VIVLVAESSFDFRQSMSTYCTKLLGRESAIGRLFELKTPVTLPACPDCQEMAAKFSFCLSIAGARPW